MPRTRILVLTLLLALAPVASAFADVTAFIGATTTPANRAAKGVALGFGVLVLGFEFEYLDHERGAARRRAVAAHRHGQRAAADAGADPRAAAVLHDRRWRLPRAARRRIRETHIGLNTGGGVKISLLGPIRARLDYRVFKLQGDAAALDRAPPLRGREPRVLAGRRSRRCRRQPGWRVGAPGVLPGDPRR